MKTKSKEILLRDYVAYVAGVRIPTWEVRKWSVIEMTSIIYLLIHRYFMVTFIYSCHVIVRDFYPSFH